MAAPQSIASRRHLKNARTAPARVGSSGLPLLLLFLTLLVAYVYTPPRWQDWNQNSRFNLTQALVDERTVRIDSYVANTGDYALIDGYAYTDKAPGLSLLAVPPYFLTDAAGSLGLRSVTGRLSRGDTFAATLNPDGEGLSQKRVDRVVALYAATALAVGAPAAAMGVLTALIVFHLARCRIAALLSALIVGFASPVFTYSQAFYGHVPAAVCLVAAYALVLLRPDSGLTTRRLVAIGALLGAATVIEYLAAVAGVPIALWALAVSGKRAAVWGTLGALPAFAVLAAYDWIAFGTILPVGYEHSALWQEQHDTGFMSLTHPHWNAIWGVSFSPFRGLFYFAPVLLLAIPGIWIALRSRDQRAPVAVAIASFGLMFLFVASSTMWWGGFAVGPRYLLPAVPFLAIPLGVLIGWVNSQPLRARLSGLGVVGLASMYSALCVWTMTFAGQGYPPDTIRRPLTGYALPALRDGDIARNLGMVLSLNGAWSLVPLLILVLLGVALSAMRLLATEKVLVQ
ncbi:MAG TPA: hypothetical protein VMM78_16950 [Thermomicrobiales bacterium]|nr:hypothetical protein [Thermomicrobiales bacterium]